MLRQVVIRAVGDAPEFAPAEREQEFEVRRRLGVECQLLRLMVAQAQAVLFDAQRKQPLLAERTPVVEPLQILAGLAEEFQLHLLKFADTEDEVAGGDFVAEGFTNLRDARRKLLAHGAHDVGEVDEDALRGFGTQVNLVLRRFHHARMGLEHQVELADAGEILLAALRADDVVLGNVLLQLSVRPAVAGFRAAGEVFNQLVCTVARLTRLAVHQRVIEAADVTRRHPHFAVHQNSAVKPHVVLAFLHKFLPPRLFHVVLEFHTQRAVVPCICQTAVQFASGKIRPRFCTAQPVCPSSNQPS